MEVLEKNEESTQNKFTKEFEDQQINNAKTYT